jgi:hypothetical protein
MSPGGRLEGLQEEGLLFLKKKKQKDFCPSGALVGAPQSI